MAFKPITPQSQKADARPIAFVLDDRAKNDPPIAITLLIRPEDLSRTDPSRMSVQQTLGGAWVDSFGAGLPNITISGHTGWRQATSSVDLNRSKDGIERFQELKSNVFAQWHQRRLAAVKAGQDPDLVKLVFADALDHFAVVVAPLSFSLRRSKSRPLLCQYQIAMAVTDQSIDPSRYLQYGVGGDFDLDSLEAAGLDSLSASIEALAGYAKDVQKFVDRTLVAPVKKFMDQTTRLYRAVDTAVRSVDGVADSLISVAQMSARAGMNLFRTIGTVASFPGHVRAKLMQVAAAYSNIFCVLNNALRSKSFYEDYSPVYGASNCSSTSGGRPISPLADTNPFYTVASPLQSGSSPVSIKTEAQSSLSTLASTDVVLSPMPLSTLQFHVSTVASGMEVAQ